MLHFFVVVVVRSVTSTRDSSAPKHKSVLFDMHLFVWSAHKLERLSVSSRAPLPDFRRQDVLQRKTKIANVFFFCLITRLHNVTAGVKSTRWWSLLRFCNLKCKVLGSWCDQCCTRARSSLLLTRTAVVFNLSVWWQIDKHKSVLIISTECYFTYF